MKFTDAALRKLSVPRDHDADSIEKTDSACPGLRVVVTRQGTRTFKLKARDATGKLRTITLGRFPELSLAEARDQATETRRRLKSGYHDAPPVPDVEIPVVPVPTLRELSLEFAALYAERFKVWRPGVRGTETPEAVRRIYTVFASYLDKSVDSITLWQLQHAVDNYKPIKPQKGKTSANGQVSQSISSLTKVFDYAARRRKNRKNFRMREPRLDVPDAAELYDPSLDDPTIIRKRQRVLSENELVRLLALLHYPAPASLVWDIEPEDEYRPAALLFMLLTLSRRGDVVGAKWRDIDFRRGYWLKPRPKGHEHGVPPQEIPLSTAAIRLLRSMPGSDLRNPEGLVFPNSHGGFMDNLERVTEKINQLTGLSDWTRHDLRRTGATILHTLHVPATIVESILHHSVSGASYEHSASFSNYVVIRQVFGNLPDPRREPLEILGRVLEALRHGIDALEVLDEQKSEIPTYPKGSFKVGGADGKLH